MKLQYSQKGVTMASLAFYLALLGFAVFTALKLFPVYMEAFTVESSVASLETDKSQEFAGAMSVRGALFKRLAINNVTSIDKDDISVLREDNTYAVEVDYETRVPYMFNIDLVLSFAYSAKVPAR